MREQAGRRTFAPATLGLLTVVYRLLGLGVRLFRFVWVPFPPGFQSLLEASTVESVENQLEGDTLLNYQAYIHIGGCM